MKLKVTVLTAAVLCVILFALDSLIYFSLQRHSMTLEQNVLTTRAQTVASALHHLNDGFSQDSDRRLLGYSQPGQTIFIIDPNGNLLAHVGELSVGQVLQAFNPKHPTQTPTIRTPDGWYMITAAPILDDLGNLDGFVMLAGDISSIEDNLRTLLTAISLGSLGAILLAAAGGYAVSSAAVRPIDQMIRIVSRIQADHLNERLDSTKGRDEVARLAQTFNQMLNRIERSFEQQSRFVADASHEIRTPLTTIQGYAALLRRWGKEDPKVLEKAIGVIYNESERLKSLTDDMLTLADLESSSRSLSKSCEVAPAVHEIVETQGMLNTEHTIETDLPRGAVVSMAPEHFKRIVTNLLVNALKYTPAGGTIRITGNVTPGTVTISVADTGQGIPEEDLPHIFDRFYRVDKARSRMAGGNGLGLAIVKELIELHGGSIEATSKVNVGTTIQFTLKRVTAA